MGLGAFLVLTWGPVVLSGCPQGSLSVVTATEGARKQRNAPHGTGTEGRVLWICWASL